MRPILLAELELPRCANTYGQAPCTASGTACYQTWTTCQDRANFAPGDPFTAKLCENLADAPAGYIPAIDRVSTNPPRIEIEKGLGLSAAVTLTINDLTLHDRAQDPYIASRATPAAGTWFGRLYARNRDNYYRRPLTLIRADLDADPVTWQRELYLIEEFSVNAGGTVTIKGKDPLTALKDARIPEQAEWRLAEDISDIDTSSISINRYGEVKGTGQGGVVQIGSELIAYGAIVIDAQDTTLAQLVGLVRGAYGTTANSHSADEAVQPAYVAFQQPMVQVLRDAFEAAGLRGRLDDVQWDAEADTWLNSTFTEVLGKPTSVRKFLEQAHQQSRSFSFWDLRAQAVRLRAIAPLPFNQEPQVLRHGIELLADTSKRENRLDDQITRVIVFYDPRNRSERGNEENYSRVEIVINADAENENAYNRERPLEVFADLIENAGDAGSLGFRIVQALGRGEQTFEFSVTTTTGEFWLGDIVALEHRDWQGVDGQPEQATVQLIRAAEDGEGAVAYQGLLQNFRERYFVWAPDDPPDFETATDEQRDKYASWANDEGLVTAGNYEAARYY